MALLREAGYNQPVYLHGAMQKLTSLYERWGVSLGAWQAATADISLAGKIVIAPPSAFGTSWIRRLNDPLICYASGWMQVRQRAKQRGVELPLILSDHADWDDLLATITEIAPKEVWGTHGREEALIHACEMRGITGRGAGGYDVMTQKDMNSFARLLESLIFSPRRSVKQAHLVSWIAQTEFPDRGWGLAALIGELDFPAVKAGIIRELAADTTDKYLFELSYDFVGDLAKRLAYYDKGA